MNVIEVEFSGQNLENSADLADWRHPVDHIEPEEELTGESVGVETLRAVINEIFDNKRGKLNPSSGFFKFLTLVWVISPETLDGKSLTALGEEIGCTKAALSKYAVRWSDLLAYRNGGQKSKDARLAYKEVQQGHGNFRALAANGQAKRTEERLAKLCGDFIEGRSWRRPDKELLRRRGLIGAGDHLTAKGKQWIESARYAVESGDPG